MRSPASLLPRASLQSGVLFLYPSVYRDVGRRLQHRQDCHREKPGQTQEVISYYRPERGLLNLPWSVSSALFMLLGSIQSSVQFILEVCGFGPGFRARGF